MRLVMDTNVIVAGACSHTGASRFWINSILSGNNTLLLTVPLVVEYEAVLKRPEIIAKSKLDASAVDILIDELCLVAETVDMNFLWRPTLGDPNDEMVLETAFLGRADVLLTFNLKDFAPAATLGVTVSRPGPAWTQFMKG